MELLKLMSDRYTCRRYSEENIKEEDLNKILEAGRVAPTSHNNQPQRIYVIKSEEAKEKGCIINGVDRRNFYQCHFLIKKS